MITPVIKTLGILVQMNVHKITLVITYLQGYNTGILHWSGTKNDVKLLQIHDDDNSCRDITGPLSRGSTVISVIPDHTYYVVVEISGRLKYSSSYKWETLLKTLRRIFVSLKHLIRIRILCHRDKLGETIFGKTMPILVLFALLFHFAGYGK
jgi:hypothetical protein